MAIAAQMESQEIAAARRPRTFRTALGDVVTTRRQVTQAGCLVEEIEIETPLSLVRDPKPTPDTGRNWET